MIYQIADIQTKTQDLIAINRGLMQARHIQARLKSVPSHVEILNDSRFGNSATNTPRLVPVLTWFD